MWAPHIHLFCSFLPLELQHAVVGLWWLLDVWWQHKVVRYNLGGLPLDVSLEEDVVHCDRILLGNLHQESSGFRELKFSVLPDEGFDSSFLLT